MLTKEEIKAGEIVESKFDKLCEEYGVPYFDTAELSNYTPLFDKLHGDRIIVLHGQLARVDVKGGAIAKSSINWFRGEYFVIFETSFESAKEAYVFEPRVFKDLIKNHPDEKDLWYNTLESKSPGLFYSRVKQLIKKGYGIPLEEFLS